MPVQKHDNPTTRIKLTTELRLKNVSSLNWPLLLSLTCLAMLACALGWVEIFSPDIGFHLNSGRWILEHRMTPDYNPFIYTSKLPYADLYWVYQIILWFVYDHTGTLGLTAGNILLAFLCFFVVGLRTQAKEGRLSQSFALILALFIVGNYWEIRPHTVSWLALGIVFAILESYRKHRGNCIWILPSRSKGSGPN